MTDRVSLGEVQIVRILYEFVNQEALPGTAIEPERFWRGFAALIERLSPRTTRSYCSVAISCRHRSMPGTAPTPAQISIERSTGNSCRR